MLATLSLYEPYGDCVPIDAVLSELETAAAPRVVEAANGKLYVAKGNGENENGGILPYVPQEVLCAQLADVAGVRIPPFQLLCFEDEIWFGSEYVPGGVGRFTRALLDRVVNPESIYTVAAFDMWIHNADRNPGNLIGIPDGNVLHLTAIDHSHCPLHPPMNAENLKRGEALLPQKCIHECYRDALTNRAELVKAVQQIQAISDEEISSAFQGYPMSFWTPEECEAIWAFLIGRRDNLRLLMNQAAELIPALQEERI